MEALRHRSAGRGSEESLLQERAADHPGPTAGRLAALIRSVGAGLALAVAFSGLLPAQVTGTWLTAGFGGERIERRDRRVSPARYSGVTVGWGGGVERRGPSTLFDANLEYIAGDLTADGIPGALDRLRRGTLETSLQLGVQHHLFAGLQLGVRAENAEHTYPFTPFPETFDAVAASLSPVVTWITPWRGGAVRVRGSAAAVSFVLRDYSRSKAGSSDGDYAGPTRWASGTLESSWLLRERSRVSWKLAMRAMAWSHRTEVGAATVETRASVSGRLRLGRIK